MHTFARYPLSVALALTAVGTSSLSASRASAQDHDLQLWNQLFFDAKFDGNWRAALELQARRGDTPQATPSMDGTVRDTANTQLLIRPWLGYAFTDWFTGWVGYLYNPVVYDNSVNPGWNEHRAWEQIVPTWTLDWMKLTLRTRFEQRFRTDGPGSGDVGFRLRQMVKGSFPITDTWSIVASDELWFHLNDTRFVTQPGVDQNRAFVGVGIKATPTVSLELGYLQQFVRRFTDPDQFNHTVAFTVIVPLDFTYPALTPASAPPASGTPSSAPAR